MKGSSAGKRAGAGVLSKLQIGISRPDHRKEVDGSHLRRWACYSSIKSVIAMGKEPREYDNGRSDDWKRKESDDRGVRWPGRDGANTVTDWDRPPRPATPNRDDNNKK